MARRLNLTMSLGIVAMVAVGSLSQCTNSSSINQEAALAYSQVVNEASQQGALDDRSRTAARIFDVARHLVPVANTYTTEKYQWDVHVVRSPALNAWAMPGGKILFYTGIVERLQLSDAEIATIMGHEMAHVLKEHGLQRTNKNAFFTFISETIKALLVANDPSGHNYAPIVDIVKDFGLTKPFSRANETEADEIGIELMAKAGYDPRYAPQLWKKMQSVTGQQNSLLGNLASTHPSNADRQANLERLLPQAIKYYQQSRQIGGSNRQ